MGIGATDMTFRFPDQPVGATWPELLGWTISEDFVTKVRYLKSPVGRLYHLHNDADTPRAFESLITKLRSLNGSEPNTRSTDERVVELRQRIADELAFILDNYNDPGMPAVSWLKEFDSWLDELFPACKPSEDNQNG